MRKIDYTLGHFVFNGHNSDEFGICIEKTPSLDRPERKHNIYQIPGRNGDIIEMLDAYDNIDKTYTVWAANDYFTDVTKDYNAIAAWLYTTNGYARLEDDFEPDIFRLAYFVGPMDVENLLNIYGKTKIKFNCRPERYFKDGEKVITVSNNSNIINKTAFTAKPLIRIAGSGNCSIRIGSHTMYITGLVDYIYIDCDNMEAYRQAAENKNNMISGDFPVIDPGTQSIHTTGTITDIKITPRWYTI